MKRKYTLSGNSSTWRKSSRSQGQGTGDCVEVTTLETRSV